MGDLYNINLTKHDIIVFSRALSIMYGEGLIDKDYRESTKRKLGHAYAYHKV